MAYRAIEDTVPLSHTLASLSDFAERLYFRMLCVSDACGRLTGDPVKIRVLCIPLLERDDDAVRDALEELIRADRVNLYCVHSVWTCQIVDFDDHQPRQLVAKLRHSRWPAPPRDADPDASTRDAAPTTMADAAPPPDADSGEVQADSGPESRAEQRREDLPPEQAVVRIPARTREAEVAALVDQSLSSGQGRDVSPLLEVLPDADVNTAKVLREIFDLLPPHFAGLARDELLAADGVRRPSAYVVRIGQRMLDEQRGVRRPRGAAA